MDDGNLSSDFCLKMEMGGFLVPSCDGGRNSIHSLDSLHDPDQDSSQEV